MYSNPRINIRQYQTIHINLLVVDALFGLGNYSRNDIFFSFGEMPNSSKI